MQTKFCPQCGSKVIRPISLHLDGGGMVEAMCTNEKCAWAELSYAPLMMGGCSIREAGSLNVDSKWREIVEKMRE